MRVATGVALGGSAALSDATVEDFRASGLAHLLAVSGGNVVLLVAAVLGLAWVAGLPRALAHGCAIPAVVAYAAIVGGGPSVVRAAATGVLVSLAWLAGSDRDPWHLLALAAAAVLALDPWAVVGPGFQLSFVAVAAIHGLAPAIRSWLEGTAVPLRLCSALAVSIACTVATAPVALALLRADLARREPAREPARAPGDRAAPVAGARLVRALAGGARCIGDDRRGGARARRLRRDSSAHLGKRLDGALPGLALLCALAAGGSRVVAAPPPGGRARGRLWPGSRRACSCLRGDRLPRPHAACASRSSTSARAMRR